MVQGQKNPPGVMFQVKSDYPACFWREMEGGGGCYGSRCCSDGWMDQTSQTGRREKMNEAVEEWSHSSSSSLRCGAGGRAFICHNSSDAPQMRSVSSHTHTHTHSHLPRASRSFSDSGGRGGGIRNHRGAFKRDPKSQ